MKVAVRTDASVQIGSGHVMRCLALGESLRELGAEVLFICREHDGHLCRYIAARGFPVYRLRKPEAVACGGTYAAWLGVSQGEDARETLTALDCCDAGRWDWLVVDHYAIDKSWEEAVHRRVDRLLAIDDLSDRQHYCDALLDASGTGAERYGGLVPAESVLLLGPAFALLRAEFAVPRRIRSCRKNVRRILVFFGGSDLGNLSETALHAVRLAQLPDVRVDVVIGGTNPHQQTLQAQCQSRQGVRCHTQVTDMASLMRRADLALGAGGVTLWERASQGLPSIVVSCAANQQIGCEHAAAAGAVLYLGSADAITANHLAQALNVLAMSKQLRDHMSRAGQDLVDARGAPRVARFMHSLIADIVLRRAQKNDCDAILEWRNAESTRQYSLNSAPVDPCTHSAWFARVLDDPDCLLLIAQQAGQPVGVLRYDRSEASATVSVYLVPGYAGQGLGKRVLIAGSAWIRKHWPGVNLLKAQIKSDNGASIASFEAAGFAQDSGLFHLPLPR